MDKNMLVVICVLMIIIICIYISAQTGNTSNANNNVAYEHVEIKENYTIIDQLKQVAKMCPDKIALKQKDKSKVWNEITYKEYYKNVEKFACAVRNFIGPNVNTAIMGFNSPGWFYAHLGCMMNGGISVGLYTTSTKEICEYIFSNTNIRLLVVEDSSQLEKFIDCDLGKIEMIIYYAPIDPKLINKFSIPIVSIGSLTKLKKINNFPKLNDVATVIYTSGTTGSPKGVVLTHENIMLNLRSMLQMMKMKSSIQFNCNEQFVSYLPLNHIAAQMMDIYIPIGLSGTVWFADKNALKSSLGKTLLEVKPTVFVGVPRVWEKICEQVQEKVKSEGIKGSVVKMMVPSYIIKGLGLQNCKFAVSVAAPISESSRDYLTSIGIKLYDIYGMSETCGPISLSLPSLSKKGSVGIPIMKVKIQKEHADDLAGEILVKGKNLFTGYYGNKKAYQASFKNDWFKTGDLGYLDQDGFLYVTGRLKELIITAGGENISPLPIESKLKEKLGKYFANIIVIGDKRKFLSLLLNEELQKCDSETIQKAIDDINNLVESNASTIKKWLIIKNKFKIGDEVTPTLKIRRDFINKKYHKEINKLYK
jgi:long-chain-fatty-acid--CoA ligase ACSBG